MANNQTTRRKRDIKTKLMAAVCMLLVSSIMMVSTTYAWFTLSTAPEVKGINTAVGANGNLEMALLPTTGVLTDIDSRVGDSVKGAEERNVTWGNLVDLSDSTVYGLDQITLFPAALNWDETTKVLAASFLKTPTYGADGRVATLEPNTVTGTYNKGPQNFMPNSDKGVRAVGTASGMTDRQLDYRNAQSAGNNATAYAKTLASQSLNVNGSALANIAIKHGMNDGSESYTVADVNALKTIVNDLNDRILPQIEAAYLQYILAYAASAASGTADTVWQAVKGAVGEAGATLASVTAKAGTLPSALTTAIGKYNDTKADVAAAKSGLDDLDTETNSDATFTWGQISAPMQKLADTSAMTVNGFKVGEVKAKLGDLISSVTAQGGLVVAMGTGAGVYADIADQCGDFTASVIIEEVTYGTLKLNNMAARMNTKTSVNPVYLQQIADAVVAAGAPASGATGSMPITDMYGYIIDLAFRTNAAESNLLLQVEAEDRIYGDNTNDDTMGGGSSMTFKATTTDFTDDQVKNLMKAIRIVFFDPTSMKVITNAKLDVDNTANLTADGWKADMYIYSVDANGTETVETDNEIMALTQNTATALSMLVYLDGNYVGNDDVAATAATSMTGKMNIQFASSANLVPMEYAALHQGTGTGTGNNNTSVTAMTAVTAADTSYKISNAAFTDKTITVKLADASDAAITTGTVTFTVDGNATAYSATYANGAWSATVTETLAANTAVTVTYTAAQAG